MITLERTAWTKQAREALSETLGDDEKEIASGVSAGKLECWNVNNGSLWLVTSVDKSTNELIVCCAAGSGLDVFLPTLNRIVLKNGLKGGRFFTKRKALARLIRKAGFGVQLEGYVFTVKAAVVN